MTREAYGIIHSIDSNAVVMPPAATWTSTTPWAWIDGFLTAGGGPYIDVMGVHGYTGTTDAATIYTIIDNVQSTQVAHGYNLPIYITEGGWGLNTVIPDSTNQADFLAARYFLITGRTNVKLYAWYQWDNASWGTLWTSGGGINQAGTAYGLLSGWLANAQAKGCSQAGNSTWTCAFSLPGNNAALAAWNPSTTVTFTPGGTYTHYYDLTGTNHTFTGSVSLGASPLFFEVK